MDAKLVERFGRSEHDNFGIVETVGVPHPYCIGARHVEHAADRFGGMLDTAAIESAERHGITCCTCKGKLKFADHKSALLVECKVAPADDDKKMVPELHEYLKASMDKFANETEYAGFAFMEARPEPEK